MACDGAEALSKATTVPYDAVLSDIRMAPFSGLDLLSSFRKTMPETPIVLLTAFGSVDTAIQAMKQGAFDYIAKPVNLDELVLTMRRAVEHRRLLENNRTLERAFSERLRAASLIGQSKKMVDVFKLVGKASRSRTAVLIQGESGTGKELIARAIHDNSPRAAYRFVAINCSAIPDTLLESEFFGHIGAEVARLAAAFGMRVIGLNRTGAHWPHVDELARVEALHDWLPRADAVVVIIIPLTDATRGLIDAKAVSLIKPGGNPWSTSAEAP